jgi:hypothetical protein
LNTGLAIEQLPGTNAIVYPQEIWDGFGHREAVHATPLSGPTQVPGQA